MSKKYFIALADCIREFQESDFMLTPEQLKALTELLADFCQLQNSRFNRDRWLSYIAGECGPSGGAVKKERAA